MLELARQKAGAERVEYRRGRRAERGVSARRIRSDRDALLLRLLRRERAGYADREGRERSEARGTMDRLGVPYSPPTRTAAGQRAVLVFPGYHGAQDPQAGGSPADLASPWIPTYERTPLTRCIGGFGAVGAIGGKGSWKRGQAPAPCRWSRPSRRMRSRPRWARRGCGQGLISPKRRLRARPTDFPTRPHDFPVRGGARSPVR